MTASRQNQPVLKNAGFLTSINDPGYHFLDFRVTAGVDKTDVVVFECFQGVAIKAHSSLIGIDDLTIVWINQNHWCLDISE